MNIDMLIQNEMNQVNEVLDSLDSEALATIGRLMQAVTMDQSRTLGHYWRGSIDNRLRLRGACTSCGGDSITHMHNSDGTKTPLDEGTPETEIGTPVVIGPDGTMQSLKDWAQGNVRTPDEAEPELESGALFIQDTLFDEASDIEPGDPVENMRANAAEYGVTFMDPEDLTGPVECINCTQVYHSLRDRMLRAPGVEGCGGCQQKAMWG